MWSIAYRGFDPAEEGTREALCTLGNGYFATRGALEFVDADDVHYPGTYLAGGYNRLVSDVAGRQVENEDLVNMPNWLCLRVRIADGPWLELAQVELVSYEQELRMRDGVLCRSMRVRDHDERTIDLRSRRLVHMGNPHLAAFELAITAVDWSGPLAVRSALDGRVTNRGVGRYRELAHQHLRPLDTGEPDDDLVSLVVETNQSHLRVAEVARTRLYRDEERISVEARTLHEPGYVAEDRVVDVAPGDTIRVEKIVALYTSRDRAISEPGLYASTAASRAPVFAELLASHAEAWAQLWRQCDIELRVPEAHEDLSDVRRLLRLQIFHVLQTVSPHTTDLDVGVPARGWTGEAYRGHVFWDELFILPFVTIKFPEITRSLLRYRSRRLDQARRLARDAGYRGAMYPWQSGSDGREETQLLHLNPRSGRWLPDASHLQRHVNAAIAYNIWQYFLFTDDYDFLHVWGAEMLVEIARFWASIAVLNQTTGRYEIHGVVGPDEYHDAYPGAAQPGLRNNAYTNVMAAWTCDVALRALDMLLPERREELTRVIGIADDELATCRDIVEKMTVSFHADGIISQFEGYEELKELDWDAYRATYGDIHRLDRILEAEGDSPNHYKLSKQADVLMLPYLFSDEELGQIFERLGYRYDEGATRRNLDYYLPRTCHGSTLSLVVHGAIALRFYWDRAAEYYMPALYSDLADIQGGTTREGIHLAALAGPIKFILYFYFGLRVSEDILVLDPPFPERPILLGISLRFRNTWLDVTYAGDTMRVNVRPGGAPSVKIGIRGGVQEVHAGQTHGFQVSRTQQNEGRP